MFLLRSRRPNRFPACSRAVASGPVVHAFLRCRVPARSVRRYETEAGRDRSRARAPAAVQFAIVPGTGELAQLRPPFRPTNSCRAGLASRPVHQEVAKPLPAAAFGVDQSAAVGPAWRRTSLPKPPLRENVPRAARGRRRSPARRPRRPTWTETDAWPETKPNRHIAPDTPRSPRGVRVRHEARAGFATGDSSVFQRDKVSIAADLAFA